MAGPTNTQFAVAVHVLTLLAGSSSELASGVLAGSAGANPAHVRRVLGQLRRAGVVASRPGACGGWRLVQDAGTVTLGDVWRVVRGEDPLVGIHGAAPGCPVGQRIDRALRDVERRAAVAVERELARTTLEDLAAETRARDLNRSMAAGRPA